MRLPLLLLLALPLAGCAVQPVGTVSPRVEAMAAAPCSRAAAPLAADVAPAYAYGIGPDDQARSALAVPPQVAICLIQGIQCALNALIPTVAPTLHPVTLAPARAAAACAPAPAPAAVVIPNPVAAPKAAGCPPPPPEPVALGVCVDGSCNVAAK